jgi:uncharacterized protein (DUF983 family)
MLTMIRENKKRSPLRLFACKCPRCREGDMFLNKNPYVFKETMKMHSYCTVCGQPLNIEVGFYYGSSYISYAFSVGWSALTFAAWWWTIGFSLYDDRIFYWLAFNAVSLVALQPYLMRVSRTGWLAIFVRYDRDWRIHKVKMPERINTQQENNW